MMEWKNHGYRVGANQEWHDDLPTEENKLRAFSESARKRIEPWLSAVFQSEHLNLLLGNGLTTAVGYLAKTPPPGMSTITFGTEYDAQINEHATRVATAANRGAANIEDQIRSALSKIRDIPLFHGSSLVVRIGATLSALHTHNYELSATWMLPFSLLLHLNTHQFS